MSFGVVGTSGELVEKVIFKIRNVLFSYSTLVLDPWVDEMFSSVINIFLLVYVYIFKFATQKDTCKSSDRK